jgi:hypothetical protein
MMRRVAASLGFALLLCTPGDGSAQSAEALAASCAAAGGDATLCARAAGAGRDLLGYVSLLAGPGAELSGQASTLGRRLGGSPRIGASLRGGGVSVVAPSLASVGGSDSSPFVTSAQATLALGLFDGFQVAPTVGGVLSFDVIASGSFLYFPESEGFDGRTQAYSVGVRLGVLRESFTLPAVTLSASRRFVGALQLGDVGGTDLGEVTLDPGVTSVRATVGKDLFAFGVLAGLAWDDFSSETTVRASNGGGGFTTSTATLEDSRWSAFGGLSKQIGVIAWISAELGWTSGFDPVSAGAGASPDVGRTFFGSVALVLKL